MPYLRATITGDTPGCKLSAAIWRFCSAVQRRRGSPRVITSMRRLRVLVRSVVGASSDSNATAITLSSFLKDDRWPYFARAAQRAAETTLTLIEGTDDPVVPVNGTGTGEGHILPANETLAFWATGNRCNGFDLAGAESREPGVTILRAIGRQCRGGDTEGWFIQEAGHGWPGSDVGYPEFLVGGRRTSAIDATSVVVDFLLRQATASSPPRIGDR